MGLGLPWSPSREFCRETAWHYRPSGDWYEKDVSLNIEKNWFDKYDQELARLLDKRNEIDEQINEVRAKILKQMESQGLDKINSEQFSVSYTPAKTVMQFDTRAFREENESLYLNYCKSKQREASIVVKRNINN